MSPRLAVKPRRRAAHDRTQKFGLQLMWCLAAQSLLPGGFLAENQKPRKIAWKDMVYMQIDHSKARYMMHELNT